MKIVAIILRRLNIPMLASVISFLEWVGVWVFL